MRYELRQPSILPSSILPFFHPSTLPLSLAIAQGSPNSLGKRLARNVRVVSWGV
jgi:hypothetical protein